MLINTTWDIFEDPTDPDRECHKKKTPPDNTDSTTDNRMIFFAPIDRIAIKRGS